MLRHIIEDDAFKLYELDQSNLKSNWSKLTYLSMINDNKTLSYMIEEDTIIKGFIIWQIKSDASADLMQLIVDKQARNQKIASQLLTQSIKTLKHKGINQFLLEVEASNTKAINLYTKFNFETIHKRNNYYGNKRDAFIMQYEVS
ncbi:MAG TPA: N-acetyltransferase [Erysipelothrix sp.]|nr:N-acetyltransferase [Erysipelothrix sp.]